MDTKDCSEFDLNKLLDEDYKKEIEKIDSINDISLFSRFKSWIHRVKTK